MNPSRDDYASDAERYPQSFVTQQPFIDTDYNSTFSTEADSRMSGAMQGNQWFPVDTPITNPPIQMYPTSLAPTQIIGGIPNPDVMISGDIFSESQTGPVDSLGNPAFQHPWLTDPLSLDEDLGGEVVDHSAVVIDPMATEQQWGAGAPSYFSAKSNTGHQSHFTTDPSGFDQSIDPLRAAQTWHEGDQSDTKTHGTSNTKMGPSSLPVRRETYPGSLTLSPSKVWRTYRDPSLTSNKSTAGARRSRIGSGRFRSWKVGTAEAALALDLGLDLNSRDTRGPEAITTYARGLESHTAQAEIARMKGLRKD